VITAKPEISPEYMRSLSPEINKELIAELCKRIIWSGGGAEARLREEDMVKKENDSASRAENERDKNEFHAVHSSYVCMCEHSQASVFTCCT